jgi:hypothetical protein
MNALTEKQCRARIERIKKLLAALGDMRPGSISEQYNVCGNPSCSCKDPTNPKKHGPYYQLSYTHSGKHTTEHVKRDMVNEVKKQIKNHRLFRELTEEWVDLSVSLAKLRKSQRDS